MSRIAHLLVPAAVLGTLAFQADPPPNGIAGTWTLVAADRIGADGVRRRDYGEHAVGRMIVDAEGRYAIQIYSAERPPFAAGDKSRGTPEEYAAASLGQSAHFGTVAVDSAHHTLRFTIEHASFPNWEGKEQLREYRLDGDELSYQVPATASGNGSVAISVWRRVR
jgi:hypothetical protein